MLMSSKEWKDKFGHMIHVYVPDNFWMIPDSLGIYYNDIEFWKHYNQRLNGEICYTWITTNRPDTEGKVYYTTLVNNFLKYLGDESCWYPEKNG